MALDLLITYQSDAQKESDHQPFSFFRVWDHWWRRLAKQHNLEYLYGCVENGQLLLADEIPLLIEELRQCMRALDGAKIPEKERIYIRDRIDQIVPFLENLDLSAVSDLSIG